MKKNIFLFAFLFVSIATNHAQPNPGFENWTEVFGTQEPDGWQTLNFLSQLTPPNPISTFRTTGINVHSGNYSLELKTVYLNNRPPQIDLNDSSGGLFTGAVFFSPLSYASGYPFQERPEKLSFWAKYIPVGSDTAKAGVMLKKANGNIFDTVAYGIINIPPTYVYTLFEINLSYYLDVIPDSAIIAFSSSKSALTARLNSTLYIDDLAFSGWVGMEKKELPTDYVKLFPNPATSNEINISTHLNEDATVQIKDVFSRVVLSYPTSTNTTKINISSLSTGLYFYEIQNRKNNVILNGKFIVNK